MTIATVIAARAANGALNTIMQVGKLLGSDAVRLKQFSSDNSLVSATDGARVEPLCLIGSDVVHLDYISDVLQSLQSIFAGYYLQAAAMTTQINGVSVVGLLAKLSPNRKADMMGAALSVANVGEQPQSWRMNSLSYEHRLPTPDNKEAMAFEHIAMENAMAAGVSDEDYTNWMTSVTLAQRAGMSVDQAKKFDTDLARITNKADRERMLAERFGAAYKPTAATINQDAIKSVREITDLSVGKMIAVTFGGGTDGMGKEIRSATIPIAIRLMVNEMPESALQNLLASGAIDNSLKERYHAWRAGRIEFIRDLIFAQDLITEHKKAMMHDNTGVQTEIVRRVNNAKIAGLAARDPSLNVASNLYVISEVTAKALEHKLGGKLGTFSVRQKIFQSGYAMIIVVIDRQWETVTFYHRDLSTFTSVRLSDIKKANKGSGPDVGDILKAYQLGSSPTL